MNKIISHDSHKVGNNRGRSGWKESEHPMNGYRYNSNRGGGGWGWSGIYPLFVEYPMQVINVNNSPSEFMQNINQDRKAKIEFPTPWKQQKWFKSQNPTCSLIQAEWKNNNEISSDSTCVCPVGNKVEKNINGKSMFKCQIPY